MKNNDDIKQQAITCFTTVGDEICGLLNDAKVLNQLIQKQEINYNCVVIIINLFEFNEQPLKIYVRREEKHYYISDGGFIWCHIQSEQLRQHEYAFDTIKKDMNIVLSSNNELFVESFSDDFALNFQNMIKAIIFLFYTHRVFYKKLYVKQDDLEENSTGKVLIF